MDRADLGKTPISEENPAGEDVRFEEDYEALSDEIEKLSSPTASGGVDWSRVIELCESILGGQSKDLLVACYLCTALTRTQGWEGLETGIHVLRDLVETFWDTLFPPKKRKKGRINALAWWEEKTRDEVAGLPAETWPKERRGALLEDLDALDGFLGDNLDDAPMLHKLKDAVGSAVTEAPEEPATPEPAAPEPTPQTAGEPAPQEQTTPQQAPSAPASPPPAAPAAGGGEDDDPEAVLEAGLNLLARASTLLADQDPLDARAVRLNRIAAWMSVESPPPADKGKTLLPPPDGQVISALESLCGNGQWQDLLESAESHVPQYLFWLDLSRYAAEALGNLDRPEAKEAVEAETRLYVERVSGIEKLRFSDGTPFADDKTRDWLASLKREGGTDAGSAPAGGSLEGEVAAAVAEALSLAGGNKVDKALETLLPRRNASGAGRERLLWNLGLCRVLLQAGQEDMLAAHVKEVLGVLDEFKLERWEPDLAVEALVLALKGLRSEEEEENGKREGILGRIALLNPVKALDLV